MFNRNQLQALASQVPTKNGCRTDRENSTYPTVPAAWPNRATRRAVKQGRMSRLSAPLVAFLALNPDYYKAIKEM
jgi:hypothetical protein